MLQSVIALTVAVAVAVLVVQYNTGWSPFVVTLGGNLDDPPGRVLFSGAVLSVTHVTGRGEATETADVTRVLSDMAHNSWVFAQESPRIAGDGLSMNSFSAFRHLHDKYVFKDGAAHGTAPDGDTITIKDLRITGYKKILAS